MFGKIILLATLALIAWAMVARASQGAGPTVLYTVKPGDTLWSIAVAHYAGDPRDGIWKIARGMPFDPPSTEFSIRGSALSS